MAKPSAPPLTTTQCIPLPPWSHPQHVLLFAFAHTSSMHFVPSGFCTVQNCWALASVAGPALKKTALSRQSVAKPCNAPTPHSAVPLGLSKGVAMSKACFKSLKQF